MSRSGCPSCGQEVDLQTAGVCWRCGYQRPRPDFPRPRPLGRRRGSPKLLESLAALFLLGLVVLSLTETFQRLLAKAGEGMTRSNLGTLRSVLHLYFAANEGRYPADLSALTVERAYLRRIPRALRYVRLHEGRGSSGVQVLSTGDYRARRFSDAGGWAYVSSGPDKGWVVVNCTHTDSRGRRWYAY